MVIMLVCMSKYKNGKKINNRSNNQSASSTGNKEKSTSIHFVTDDDEVLKIT